MERVLKHTSFNFYFLRARAADIEDKLIFRKSRIFSYLCYEKREKRTVKRFLRPATRPEKLANENSLFYHFIYFSNTHTPNTLPRLAKSPRGLRVRGRSRFAHPDALAAKYRAPDPGSAESHSRRVRAAHEPGLRSGALPTLPDTFFKRRHERVETWL